MVLLPSGVTSGGIESVVVDAVVESVAVEPESPPQAVSKEDNGSRVSGVILKTKSLLFKGNSKFNLDRVLVGIIHNA